MKNFLRFSLLLVIAVFICSFTHRTPTPESEATKLKWYTWEEAIKANEQVKKKIFIDIYTDWCGWCKVMDKNTFQQEQVAAYIQKHFYPVKLNAEQKEDIMWNDRKFEFIKAGRRGVHTLAYSLLDGKLSYPSIVMMTEDYERIMISKGYKKPNQIMPELKFAAEEHYKTMGLKEYKSKQ